MGFQVLWYSNLTYLIMLVKLMVGGRQMGTKVLSYGEKNLAAQIP